MIDVKATFEKFMGNDAESYEYLEFARIKKPLHPRPDVAAFLLLDRLVPNPGCNMVSSAAHDEFFLDVDVDDLAKAATDEDVLTLVRCGVMYHSEFDCLYMFA